MSDMTQLFDKKQSWTKNEISMIEYNLLRGSMGCRTTEAVESAITYAHYLNSVGINNSNYPIFLKVLGVKNHWVIDALLGTRDPFLFMSSIQPNYFIVGTCFSFLAKFLKGDIYPKTLGIILGVFQTTFNSPLDGYKIYPPTIADLNSLGKHLVEEKGQDDLLNRSILDIMDKFSQLEGLGKDEEMEAVAVHAHNIRNNFFDSSKNLVQVIPDVLLKHEQNLDKEVPPRNFVPLTEGESKGTTPRRKASEKPEEPSKSE
jgi:hypothetical protein